MNIVFFEVQEWEKEALKKAFPNATCTKEKLTLETATEYKEAEVVSTFIYSSVTRSVLNKLPKLKLITTRSTGHDHIDTSAAHEKNVVVCNVPEYGSRTVAEHTFALMLTLTRKIYQSINQVKHYEFEHDNIRGIDLQGKTIGIVGLGKIGMEILTIAKAFDMRVLVNTRTKDPKREKKYGYSYATLDELLSTSDIITLSLPYNKDTHHIINKDNINKFKKGSYLINTARGGLVETEAMLKGLEDDILSGVGLDVLEEEDDLTEEIDLLSSPRKKKSELKMLVMNHLLINHPRVIITPHNAFNSKEALDRITKTTIENIKACEHGACKYTV